ncbi:MAG: HEAT repeat domain-containing protein [Cyanobacteriota bacterium]|nr:HEAT repeat domain-containing protein [Cyanobacteriota bacterium]
MVQLLESTSDDFTRQQAAYILGKINPGNEKAIHSLVQLLESTLSQLSQNSSFDPNRSLESTPSKPQVILLSNSSEFICIQAAESLWEIDPGNKKAIDALVQLLKSTSYEFICIQALLNLDKIGAKNQKAIDALVQLLGSTSDDSIYWQAAYSLGKIDPGNKKAIDALVQLLGSTSDDSIYWQAAYSLGKIDPGNQNSIDALIQLLGSTLDNDIRRYAAHRLGEILVQEQMAKVATSLKDCLSEKSYRYSSDRFLNCYKIIWKCAQTLPYPEFYQAWHPPFRFKKPLWLS